MLLAAIANAAWSQCALEWLGIRTTMIYEVNAGLRRRVSGNCLWISKQVSREASHDLDSSLLFKSGFLFQVV